MGDTTVKDDGYPARVLEDLRELYSEGHLVDTTLTLAECGTVFYAHRCVLVAASPYFRSLMNREELGEDVTVKGVSAESFQHILNFIYTGELGLNSESVSDILSAARLLLVAEAITLCQEYASKVSIQEAVEAEATYGGEISDEEVEKPTRPTRGRGRASKTASAPVLSEIKFEPEGTISDTEVPQEITQKTRRSHRRIKETPKIKDKAVNESSKRRGRKPKRYEEDETVFKPPKVPPDIKLKLYKLIKPKPREEETKERSQKKGKRGRKLKEAIEDNNAKEIVEDNDMLDDDHDKDYIPEVPKSSVRKRGRPKKGEEPAIPRKKVKSESSVEKGIVGKRGRKLKKDAKSLEVWEDDSLALNSVLPRLECPLCAYRFYHQAALQLHLRRHKLLKGKKHILQCYSAIQKCRTFHLCVREPKGKAYTCRLCNKSFTLQGKCTSHIKKVHMKKKSKCRSCKLVLFTKRAKLLHRCVKKKKVIKRRPCGICSRVFKSEKLLKKHKEDMHPGKELGVQWECRHCKKTYLHKARYIVHLVGHGLNDKEVDLEFSDPSRVPIRKSLKGIKKDPSNPLPYKCPNCVHRYKTLPDLNVHLINKHNQRVLPPYKNQAKKVRCEEQGCERVFSCMKDLRSHMTSQHSEASYDCYLCDYKTSIKRLLRLHLKYKHTGLDDRTCADCGKTFRKRYHYKIHMVSKHGVEDPEVKVFKCDVEGCDYKTYARYVLDIHMRKHDKEKPFSCNVCGRKLKSQKAVDKHVSKVHMGIRPFICDICGASYGEEHELKMHIVRHSDVKQFQCEHCDYATHDKGNFQNHLYTKHGIHQGRFAKNKALCSICGFTTAELGKLEDHMNIHKGVKAHQCPICPESFFTKARLREHKDWKHNKTTYKCDYCPFSGPTKFYVKEHTRVVHTHRDIKPYKCAYCDFRCRVSGNCRRHIESRHRGREVRWVKVCEKYPEDYRQEKVTIPSKPKTGKKKGSNTPSAEVTKPCSSQTLQSPQPCCSGTPCLSGKPCLPYDITQSEDMQVCDPSFCDPNQRVVLNQPSYLKSFHFTNAQPVTAFPPTTQEEDFTQHLQHNVTEESIQDWISYEKYCRDDPKNISVTLPMESQGYDMDNSVIQSLGTNSNCDTSSTMVNSFFMPSSIYPAATASQAAATASQAMAETSGIGSQSNGHHLGEGTQCSSYFDAPE